MFHFGIVTRAFSSNLQSISVSGHERKTLEAVGVLEPVLQRYLVWRRSIALVVVIATVLSVGFTFLIDNYQDGNSREGVHTTVETFLEEALEGSVLDEEETAGESPVPTTLFGSLADGVEEVSFYGLPLASLAILFCWNRFKVSNQIVVAGFVLTFFVPMIVALCPWSWWGYIKPNVTPESNPAKFVLILAENALEGAKYLFVLLPTVLSLVPGVQRACLRVKTLLPESMLPGWILVAAAPLYALALLVTFVAINQVASDPIFLTSVVLFLAGPFIYVAYAETFTRPLLSNDEFAQMRFVQMVVGVVTAVAGILLILYLTTHQVLGIQMIGMDEESSVLRPVDLVGFFLELIGRSMFMTLLGADILVRFNMTAWKHAKILEASPEAAGYHRVMQEFQQMLS